jgi:hypothetical protein
MPENEFFRRCLNSGGLFPGTRKGGLTMDMADIKVSKSAIKDVGREAKDCFNAMTDNNIEIRLRFSILDLALTATGIIVVAGSACMLHRALRDRRIKCETRKLAKEKEKEKEA